MPHLRQITLRACMLISALLGGEASGGPGPGYLFPDSDRRLIAADELLDLDADQLWHARNEIYARRGYQFQTPRGQKLLASLPPPAGTASSGALTATERANIDLFTRFEGYLNDEPSREFESAYVVHGADPVTLRSCIGPECAAVGTLQPGCTIRGDWRMDSESWLYVRSATCTDAPGPAPGYVPKSAVALVAG